MVYLINTTYYNKDTKEIIDLLKIGYSEDSNWKARLTSYKLHNPCCKVLFTIEGITEEYEKLLHLHFYNQRFPDYGKEWFYYDQSIIDYFDTHKIIKDFFDLDYLKDKIDYSIKITKKKDIADKVVKYLTSSGKLDSSNSISEYIQILEKFSDVNRLDEFKAWKIIEEDYGIIQDEVISFIDSEINIDIPDSIMSEVDDFMIKFRSFPHFTDKMRLLCESRLSEKALSLVLKQIPIDYSTYYIALGSERLKARGYKRGELEKEYISQKESVSGSPKEVLILNNFVVGERYSVKSVKEKLKELYSQNNIKTTPKAVELFNYFDIMKTRVKDETTGKFIDAYRILKKKN